MDASSHSTMRGLVWFALFAAACGRHGSGDCAGLTLADCRLTDGCKADTCFACLCDLSYRGCLSVDETPAQCPALGCPGADCCSSDAQCTTGTAFCAPPGASAGCGVCNMDPSDCAADADCKPHGATMICEPITCTCIGAKACVAGCTQDSQCGGPGLVCDLTSSRCVAKPCATDDQCPDNFHCGGTACARTTCATDLDCDGYCVNGACYEQTGQCTPPAA